MANNDPYMTPDHPDAFVDFPESMPAHWDRKATEKCPKCKGHGGWNLKLNCYPLHDLPNTPENRHTYAHFRAGCNQCWGYGWVTPEETKCVHEYELGRNVGKCLNEWICQKCGKVVTVDSSD